MSLRSATRTTDPVVWPARAHEVRLLGAAALTVLSALISSPAAAEQRYEPEVSLERMTDTLVVNGDGSYRETREVGLRIETSEGISSFGAKHIAYSGSLETIQRIEAWLIQPDGTRIVVPPESIRDQEEDNGGGSSEFSDTKYKVIIYPQVRVGSRLYARTESSVRPTFDGQLFKSYSLSPSFKTDQWEVNITMPSGKPLYIERRGVAGGLEKSSAAGDYYRFTWQHPTSTPPDEVAVSDFDYADTLRVSTLPDVEAVGKLYRANAASKSVVTDRIRALAVKLTDGITDEREKAKALYVWVSRNIRYVSVVLGNGGYVPHSADEVLGNAYGDCKDHVVLLEALLAAVGIDSVPALINSSTSYTLPAVGVFDPFDHVITYLPTLDLYVDSTARFAPFGVLPFDDSDKPVILTSLGRLGRTPTLRADSNFTRTRISMVVHSDGSIEGTSIANLSGTHEIRSRSARFNDRGDPEDQVVKGLLSRFGETGSGSLKHVDPEDIDAPYWIEGHFQLDPVANMPGHGAMRIPVGLAPGSFALFAGDKPAVSSQQPPWPCGSFTVSESYTIQFPATVRVTSIPENAAYHDGRVDFHSVYRRVGREVTAARSLVVQRPSQVCNKEDLEQWRAFLIAVQRDLRSQIFYQ